MPYRFCGLLDSCLAANEDQQYELREPTLKVLESIKWYLWHGNTYEALQHLETLEMDLDAATDEENKDTTTRKLLRAVEEFHTYIANNQSSIHSQLRRALSPGPLRQNSCRLKFKKN